jgi:arginase
MNIINLIGFASGIAANNKDCQFGPSYLHEHPDIFLQQGLKPQWQYIETLNGTESGLNTLASLGRGLTKIAHEVIKASQEALPFAVIGGDHSVAMGTWTGLLKSFEHSGDLGLLWLDAHMDSHTPESSLTKNPHGMPLSYLLGIWDHKSLTFAHPKKVIKPENVCLIGIRSYEQAEYDFLQKLGVKIYFMEEVRVHGIKKIMQWAFDMIRNKVNHIGLSIDLDVMEPSFCPGVGCREPLGIDLIELLDFFKYFSFKEWCGLEIAEFNPKLDKNNLTAKAIAALIKAVYY